MGIVSIEIDRQTYDSLGLAGCELPLLEPLRMSGLSKVVVLAGPNGAGKSRVMRLVRALMAAVPSPDELRKIAANVQETNQNIQTWQTTITQGSSDKSDEGLERLVHAKKMLEVNEAKIARIRGQLVALTLDSAHTGKPVVVEFVPPSSQLQSPEEVSDLEVKGRANLMTTLGVLGAEEAAPAYLRSIMRAAYRATGQTTNEAIKAIEAESQLIELMRRLLGATVVPTLNEDFNLVIEGVALTQRGLSPGQQVLFQFGCMLHAQGGSLGSTIVLMDEPENHLHPQVMITLIDEILAKLGPLGQVWIATHSVPLVAHLATDDPSCLWLVEDATVKSAKRAPEVVLNSLMGGEHGPERLRDFLRLPGEYAALRFMVECLEPPGVVGPDIKDPQTLQISSMIENLRDDKGRLRILDFGAGKARLLSTLAQGGSDATSWLDYFAFDIDNVNAGERIQELKAVYGEDASKRALSPVDLENRRLDAGSVDVVVMCNVLHEIDPDTWLSYFGPRGKITNLLKQDGYLLVVEDYGIPIGERAHRYGFLLLDESELCALFKIGEAERAAKQLLRATPASGRYSNRLVAHLIAKPCVGQASEASRREAIAGLCDRMNDRLSEMLEGTNVAAKAHVGRDYARTAQLVANALVWLKSRGE
jgi:predicted ATPase/SAM-dependent methyltransferase